MKFQPGQSGNPAGRPLGARNKKTIAMEEELAERAEKAVDRIVFLAGGGHAAAMRICAEWLRPGGNSRAPALELPPVRCAADAQKALDMVIEAFGDGAITVRELPVMLGAVDRMARVAERIQLNRESEYERYGKQRVHGVHPDMIPKPTGEPDRYAELVAALERGEDPFPDDPVKSAKFLEEERLYSSVDSDAETASLLRAAGEGGESEHSEGEPGGGTFVESSDSALEELRADGEPDVVPGAPEQDALYSPVNLLDEPPPGAADAALASPSGGGISGETLYFPVNSSAAGQAEGTAPDAYPADLRTSAEEHPAAA